MTDTPTGRRAERNGTVFVEFERTFAAPIDDMWAAVTESERLERWIGLWTGDPASGEITFRMTAEGPDVPEETIYIDQCEKPTLLTMRSARPDDPALLWKWRFELHEEAGVTTLTFAQEAVDVDLVETVGPGWDYYLDRMAAAVTGGDVAAIDFDDYYPAFAAHYRAEFGLLSPPQFRLGGLDADAEFIGIVVSSTEQTVLQRFCRPADGRCPPSRSVDAARRPNDHRCATRQFDDSDTGATRSEIGGEPGHDIGLEHHPTAHRHD